jgi:hypothetical protein
MAPEAVAFLAEPAARGATVVVLGRCPPELCAAVTAAIGATGLLVVCAPSVAWSGAGAAYVRASEIGTPILSHAADLVLVPSADGHDAELLVEEARRVLAPRGEARLVLAGLPDALVRALSGARFREVEVRDLWGARGVAGVGPG